MPNRMPKPGPLVSLIRQLKNTIGLGYESDDDSALYLSDSSYGSDSSSEEDPADDYVIAIDSQTADFDFELIHPMSIYVSGSDGTQQVLPTNDRITSETLKDLFKRLNEKGEDGRKVAGRLLTPFTSEGVISPSSAYLDEVTINNWFSHLVSKYPHRNAVNILSLYDEKYLTKIAKDGPLANERSKLKSASTIYWPINASLYGSNEKNHWFVLIIKNSNVYCFDTLNSHSAHPKLFSLAKDLLLTIHPNTKNKITFSSITVPIQNNAYDCGTGMCYLVWKDFQGVGLDLYRAYSSACDYSQFRVAIAAELSSQEKGLFYAYGKKREKSEKRKNSKLKASNSKENTKPMDPQLCSPRRKRKRKKTKNRKKCRLSVRKLFQ